MPQRRLRRAMGGRKPDRLLPVLACIGAAPVDRPNQQCSRGDHPGRQERGSAAGGRHQGERCRAGGLGHPVGAVEASGTPWRDTVARHHGRRARQPWVQHAACCLELRARAKDGVVEERGRGGWPRLMPLGPAKDREGMKWCWPSAAALLADALCVQASAAGVWAAADAAPYASSAPSSPQTLLDAPLC
jgi:hypothetical protein